MRSSMMGLVRLEGSDAFGGEQRPRKCGVFEIKFRSTDRAKMWTASSVSNEVFD